MNKQMIEFYNALLDQKDLSEEAVDEALTTAIIVDDSDLVKKAFGKITEDMVCSVDNPYMDFAIRKMASGDVLSLLKNGYPDRDPSPMPTIFAGYPEDMISFYKSWKGLDRPEALSALCLEVDYYLGVIKDDRSCYRIQFAIYDNDEYKPYFFSYIDEWVTRFLKIVKNEIKDKERLKHFIKKVLIHPELCKSMDYVFSEFSSKFLDDSWLINGAIISDNLKATEALLKIASVNTLKSISFYPRSNTKILDLLFSNNVLLPGSSKGFNAFCDYIFHDEPNEKILKQIISPSYLEKKHGDYYKQIPLMLAASNENFPLYLYSDLILSPATLSIKDNQGNNILLNLAKSDYFDSMNHLIKLGADPFVTDKKGNNVLHLLLQNKFLDFYSLQDYCSFLPTELLEMKNADGETPLEMFANEIKQKFSPKDKVDYSKINNFLFDEDSIGDGKNKNLLITGSDDDVRNAVFIAIKEHQETFHKRNVVFCQTYYDYDSVNILENLLDEDEKTAIYIHELADLLYTDFGKDIERLLSKLALKENIFIIASTSRASAEIITRTIKSVFPLRLSSRLSSEMSSKLVFGESGAEELGVNKFMTMNQTNGSIGIMTLFK